MELPKSPIKASRQNPGTLIIFGKPKCGKTTITAALTLTGKWLLIELEKKGADYVDSTHVQINNLKELVELDAAIKKAGMPYEGVILDTATKLEEMCLPLAAQLYRATPMGGTWAGKDVRTLPNGSGYLYLRKAYFQMSNLVEGMAHNTIILGHLADKLIGKAGEEVSSVELDLTGKISKLAAANADAIAYCYREENETILSFASSEEVVCGSRASHLKGQKIVIADSDESGKITTYWDKIYLPE